MLSQKVRRWVKAMSPEDKAELLSLLNMQDKDDDARGAVLVGRMSSVIGYALPLKGRKDCDVWARAMVAYQLIEEGFSTTYAGKAIGRDHATAIFLHNKVRDALRYPHMYADIIPIWNEFKRTI